VAEPARQLGPRRDEHGRIITLTDLLGYAVAGCLISVAAMVAVDGLFALLGLGKFGDLNGWLGLIFPAIIFVEQFRAARGSRGRLPVALLAAVVALGLGFAAAGFVGLPALFSGAIAALVATVGYATIWHVGLTIARPS
jgi:hypothetical protein